MEKKEEPATDAEDYRKRRRRLLEWPTNGQMARELSDGKQHHASAIICMAMARSDVRTTPLTTPIPIPRTPRLVPVTSPEGTRGVTTCYLYIYISRQGVEKNKHRHKTMQGQLVLEFVTPQEDCKLSHDAITVPYLSHSCPSSIRTTRCQLGGSDQPFMAGNELWAK